MYGISAFGEATHTIAIVTCSSKSSFAQISIDLHFSSDKFLLDFHDRIPHQISTSVLSGNPCNTYQIEEEEEEEEEGVLGGRAGMNAHFLTLGCFTPMRVHTAIALFLKSTAHKNKRSADNTKNVS